METPSIFLTDYASYNNGSQFEFGHWVDLTDFIDVDHFMDYVKEHFADADKQSPLDSPREEIMITDYKGFPSTLYSESMSEEDFEKVFLLIDWMKDNGLENLDNEGDNLFYLWNDYAHENCPDDAIYNFDDDFFRIYLSDDPMEAFRLGCFSQINWNDKYLRFNGYGNLESLDDPSQYIDETVLFEWLIENL